MDDGPQTTDDSYGKRQWQTMDKRPNDQETLRLRDQEKTLRGLYLARGAAQGDLLAEGGEAVVEGIGTETPFEGAGRRVGWNGDGNGEAQWFPDGPGGGWEEGVRGEVLLRERRAILTEELEREREVAV
jgi:hypothetical protein